ncbi:MAG TPA: alpha/beta hydrolase [Burkholderiaceae bacterium]|jgi:alpha/beta superfamily hydrolase|nr:alpha/beta hydrolase [Burkholderiaceae bacterium]
MPASIEKLLVDGPRGNIELALDWPANVPHGIAFVGHPHPLFGGTLDNKVVATIARTFAGLGWLTVRLNFRGVGRSDGTHDEGRGETEDFLHLVDMVPTLPTIASKIPGPLPIALAGFSFGTFVAAKVAHTLAASNCAIKYVVLIGAAAGKWPMPDVVREALVIHGELDETIPLASVLDWARPQDLPIVVIPGADHFFHRRLGLLKRLISAHILGMPAIDAASQSD